MILFKITNCPDKSQIGVYQHENLSMTIGSADADMVIDDPDIGERQLEISFNKGQFFVTNLHKKVIVRLNGAEIGAKATPLKSNDSISMGGTSIFFTQLNDKEITAPPRYVNENAETRLHREGSNENVILRALDELAGDGQKSTAPPRGPGSPPPHPKGR